MQSVQSSAIRAAESDSVYWRGGGWASDSEAAGGLDCQFGEKFTGSAFGAQVRILKTLSSNLPQLKLEDCIAPSFPPAGDAERRQSGDWIGDD
jgi:hypothetical protein